jgi:hypothetical protein
VDAIDILGSLLGKKSGEGGLGGKILKDILLGGSQRTAPAAPPNPSPRTSYPDRGGREYAPSDFSSQARELEDLLNVANGRRTGRVEEQRPHMPPVGAPGPREDYPYAERPDPRYESTRTVPAPRTSAPPPSRPSPSRQVEQAEILIRAMINAAKADGEISPDEQEKILAQLSSPTPEAINFLRREFSQPLDVREFAWSVPLGLEQQVYTMSLIGMRLDRQSEAQYLSDLAHGLRIPPNVRQQIHRHYGAPDVEG